MEIVLTALVAAAVAVSVALLLQRPRAAQAAPGAPPRSDRTDGVAGSASPAARSDELEDELRVRRDELARLEERLRAKEGSIELQSQEMAERDRALTDRQRNLDHGREELKAANDPRWYEVPEHPDHFRGVVVEAIERIVVAHPAQRVAPYRPRRKRVAAEQQAPLPEPDREIASG